ncbi:50S ribosomal protein L6 [candidate division KSB1 bacterium]|nr:50S ribosomal protein L6 [candidate division KSB1 bacterium]
MSRVGKLPIPIPDGVSFDMKESLLSIKGPKGDLSQDIPLEIKVRQKENKILVESTGGSKRHRAFHGLFRALINNMVIGVSEGFKRDLEIQGVGYTAALNGKNLVLNLGFSHPILFKPPGEVELEVPSRTEISVKGINKQLVGEIAAKIRSFKPPEPYKGKGIRYLGEEVRRKVGKTAGAAS